MNQDIHIERLNASHAAQIQECFRRVYGESYANELFYDLERLRSALDNETLCSVGAINAEGALLGHMAMSLHPGARHTELGNTVVDPAARGAGLAWKVGAALTAWAVEKGFQGYLHYPTTDHHIMQQQSVKRGFETGLMLGYIPAETDGQVRAAGKHLRGAATIVFEPLAKLVHQETCFLPAQFAETVKNMAATCGIARNWVDASSVDSLPPESDVTTQIFGKRDLARLEVLRVGTDIEQRLKALAARSHACTQVDLRLDDRGIATAVNAALGMGFVFCGWLPGYRECDVLRLQAIDPRSDLDPDVVNPTGKHLLAELRPQLAI